MTLGTEGETTEKQSTETTEAVESAEATSGETTEAQAAETAGEETPYEAPSLNDILDNKLAAPAEKAEQPESKPEESSEEAGEESKEAETEDASEEEKPAETEPEATAESGESPDTEKVRKGLTAALADERQKRQALQEELQALKEQERPYLDEEAEKYHQAKIAETEAKHQEKFLNMSVALTKAQFPDYEEHYQVFAEAVQSEASKSPNKQSQLLANALAAENPALYAYEHGKNMKFREQYGKSPDQLRANLEKELRPKIEKELKEKFMGKVAAKNKQPTSLSKVRAAGGDSSPDWKPTPLESLLGR